MSCAFYLDLETSTLLSLLLPLVSRASPSLSHLWQQVLKWTPVHPSAQDGHGQLPRKVWLPLPRGAHGTAVSRAPTTQPYLPHPADLSHPLKKPCPFLSPWLFLCPPLSPQETRMHPSRPSPRALPLSPQSKGCTMCVSSRRRQASWGQKCIPFIRDLRDLAR